MRFLSNFAFTIMFMCSINFWHQQDCNSLFIGSIGHETSQWPINAKFLKTVCALLYFTRICRNTNFSTWYLKEQTAAFPVIVINTKNQSKNILNPILKEELSDSDRGTMSRRGFVIEIKVLLCFYLGLLFLQRIINQLRAFGAAETCFPAGRIIGCNETKGKG